MSIHTSAQKKVIKKISLTNEEIEINTAGLDHIVLENSDSKFLEVYLFAEEYDDQLINLFKENNIINVNFQFKGTETREVVFRKFITKRLQRANAIIKIPKEKKILIFGENVDITSKSIQNNLSIFIDNGIIKLNKVKQNTSIKFYAGNLYANTSNIGIDVTSNLGKILIDAIPFERFYKNDLSNFLDELKVSSIKANLFIQTN